jgi:hypothetical protein
MALALVLLIGAGLMIRSLSGLWSVDPGFRPDNVLTFGLGFTPLMRSATPEAKHAYLRELSQRISDIPGVRAASFCTGSAPLRSIDNEFFWLDGHPPQASAKCRWRSSIGLNPAIGRPPIHSCRAAFQCSRRGANQAVVVIDEVFARQHFRKQTDRQAYQSGVRDPLQRRSRRARKAVGP